MKIRVGSRDSALAVAQALIIINQIKKANPELEIELITMKTTGDMILDKSLDKIGGKGLFVKELDKALIDGRIDIAIHSLKDLPMEINEDLPIVAYSKRESVEDVLILKPTYEKIIEDGIIGTSSKRREIQLKSLYPNMRFKNIRGNIQTRIKKLCDEDFDATILALAGIKRLKLENYIYKIFKTDEIIPAAGQGIIAVQGRKDKDYLFLDYVNYKTSELCALCERSFVKELNGDCSSPIAAYAEIKNDKLLLRGLYCKEDEEKFVSDKMEGNINEAEKLGRLLAKKIKKNI